MREGSPPGSTTKKKVAIVDDEEDLRNVMSLILRTAGHEVVVTASDGEEIVKSLADGGPEVEVDTILMDYAMPKMNGLEASRIIASKKPEAKIIFVSGADIRQEVERAGFAFIAKPFSIDKLLDVVDE